MSHDPEIQMRAYLSALRTVRDLTMSEAAALADLHPSTLSKWEGGGRWPDVRVLSAYLSALGASAKERATAHRIYMESAAVALGLGAP